MTRRRQQTGRSALSLSLSLSSPIRLRNADLDLRAPPFGDGLRLNVLLRVFTVRERRRGSYKSNSAKEP